jgi:hypothetical protein
MAVKATSYLVMHFFEEALHQYYYCSTLSNVHVAHLENDGHSPWCPKVPGHCACHYLPFQCSHLHCASNVLGQWQGYCQGSRLPHWCRSCVVCQCINKCNYNLDWKTTWHWSTQIRPLLNKNAKTTLNLNAELKKEEPRQNCSNIWQKILTCNIKQILNISVNERSYSYPCSFLVDYLLR